MTPTFPLFPRPPLFSPHVHALSVQGRGDALTRFCAAASSDGVTFDVSSLLRALNLGVEADPLVTGLVHFNADTAELHFQTLGPLGVGALRELHSEFGLDGTLYSLSEGLYDAESFQGWVKDGEVSMLDNLDMEDEDRDEWIETVRSALERREELELNARSPRTASGAPRTFGTVTWRTGS